MSCAGANEILRKASAYFAQAELSGKPWVDSLIASGAKPRTWFGSVIQQGQEATALQFKRNRYYNAERGAVTQEDPIGLAGGANLYGFANGDPVNFADPFGLQCRPIREHLNPARECFPHTDNPRVAAAAVALLLGVSAAPLIAASGVPLAGGGSGVAALTRIAGAAPAATAGAATAVGAASKLTIQFGRVANQVEHAFRHTDKLGLDRNVVIGAIQSPVPSVASRIVPGQPLNQIITIEGQRIQYTAFEIAKGVINVGRIHPVP